MQDPNLPTGQWQHCTQCLGAGKVKPNGTRTLVTCLHCAGIGIEPRQEQEQKPTHQRRHIIGPLHTYPGMRRDAMIVVGLVVLLLVLRTFGG